MSNAVMVGFLSAVGVNIVLGQLANFTGYQAQGSNRVARTVDTLLHPARLHLQTLAIGAITIALILLLRHQMEYLVTTPQCLPSSGRPRAPRHTA